MLVYWDDETMDLLSVISDHLVHAVRSTAPNGPMTKYLAREGSTILAVIGTGRLARWAAEAAWSQRPIKTIQVYSRDPKNREEFCAFISERLEVETVNCASNDEAVAGADVVVMATSTRVPVINGSALKPGCTVITNTPEELDKDTVRRASRIVSSSVLEAENHIPPFQAIADLRQAGEIPHDGLIDELCDVIVGRKPGRISGDEIIIGLNPAHGVHDVAAAKFTYERALEMRLGTDLSV
jgi:ornithine cyclodeaminase